VTRTCAILLTRVDCARDCAACREEWAERAAILEHGQGTGGTPERPTCATRAEAEALARDQLRERLAGERRGQMPLAV
jgi:hypothetical protein